MKQILEYFPYPFAQFLYKFGKTFVRAVGFFDLCTLSGVTVQRPVPHSHLSCPDFFTQTNVWPRQITEKHA